MDKHYLTPERLIQLKEELNELKTKKRIEVADRLKRAKELGDLSENSEYLEAREEQGQVEQRIFELEDIIKSALTIKKSSSKTAQVGSTVVVKKGNNKEMELTIVGSNEAQPEKGFISNESPLGRAVLEKKAGDEVDVEIPAGSVKYKIISVK
ncbi:MAG: transcription elongation factor GreA [Patescibacteria group bacterium]